MEIFVVRLAGVLVTRRSARGSRGSGRGKNQLDPPTQRRKAPLCRWQPKSLHWFRCLGERRRGALTRSQSVAIGNSGQHKV